VETCLAQPVANVSRIVRRHALLAAIDYLQTRRGRRLRQPYFNAGETLTRRPTKVAIIALRGEVGELPSCPTARTKRQRLATLFSFFAAMHFFRFWQFHPLRCLIASLGKAMRRRDFIKVIGGTAAVWTRAPGFAVTRNATIASTTW